MFMRLPWGIHVLGLYGLVQQGKLQAQFAGMVRLNAGFASRPEKAFQPFVHERPDHAVIVKCLLTVINWDWLVDHCQPFGATRFEVFLTPPVSTSKCTMK